MGLWDEAAKLFARDGEMVWGDKTVKGADAIAAEFTQTWGHGQRGLAPGRLHVVMDMAPVVTLGPDGRSGKGRWHELAIDAQFRQRADWTGGIQENEYRQENGVWKFARLHYYPLFAGPYKGGWRNVSADPKTVPYHYTADEAGVPSLALAEGAPLAKPAPLAALAGRVHRLDDEAQVLRLQNAYGYYVDRRMWDDVADLFAPDGTLEAAEGPRLTGPAAIRKALEATAPAGLKPGELNDHLQLDVVVTIDPDGRSAHARGIDLGMVGKNGGDAAWSLALFENDFVKKGGVWMVRAMRLYPRATTDYYKGWAESALVDHPLAGDAPSRLQYPAQGFPALSFRNPATGQAPAYPASLQILPIDRAATGAHAAPAGLSHRGRDRRIHPCKGRETAAEGGGGGVSPLRARATLPALSPLGHACGMPPPFAGEDPGGPAHVDRAIGKPYAIGRDTPARIGSVELARQLWIQSAYDGAENVSTAYGYYIDEFHWHDLAQLFAEKGWKELSYIGAYVGRDRVLQSLYERYGKGDGRKGAYLAIHQKVQPVVTVAPDGQAAHVHMHLFQLGSSPDAPGAQIGGIYENRIILEHGLWKIAAMDLDYVWTSSYANGWGKVAPGAARQFAPPASVIAKYPPDRPLRGPAFAPFPEIEPILFSYRNPVSGRTPPLFLDGEVIHEH